MSGILSNLPMIITDLSGEDTTLNSQIVADQAQDPDAAFALETQLSTNVEGIELATDILGVSGEISTDSSSDPSAVPGLELQLNDDQNELLDLDLLLCFAHGTHILTERGEIPIECLKIGDYIATPYAATVTMPIRWIGRQHRRGNAARFAQPVLVQEGALGNGLPHRDLHVSPDHCLYLDNRLIPAKLLVNGMTVLQKRGSEPVDYINIELDHHTVVLAEGAAAESYLDCGNRNHFDNANEPSEWLSSRSPKTGAAWHDGSAFAQPLWSGAELTSIFQRLCSFGKRPTAA